MNDPRGYSGPASRWWRLLLLVPVIATLWVPWFAHTRPTLFGIPFFYWYLMAWVPAGATCTAIVYYKTRDSI
jgi:hypothetical protein